MTKRNRRRWLALLLPLPVMAAAYGAYRLGWTGSVGRVALEYPEIVWWYLLSLIGVESRVPAQVAATGYWYLLLSLGFYAALCGRDRVSRAMVVCVVATTAVVGLMALALRGWNPD